MEILQGEIGFDLNLIDIQDKTEFAINSPGGSLFEGLAMYDYIENTDIKVGCIGLCASAATLPLLASKERWGTPNSRYLIHNPWSRGGGDAKDFQRQANELKAEEQRILDIYSKKLLISKEAIQVLLNENKIIDAQEALRIGLILEIRNLNKDNQTVEGTDIKALYTDFKMQINLKMNENEEIKKEFSGLKMLIEKAIRLFVSPKMLVIQDVNGMSIDFGASVETNEQIVVGVSATVDGSPANGEYILADGKTLVFESGNLTKIVEANSNEVDALKEENTALKAELETFKDAKMKAEKDLTLLKEKSKSELENIKLKFDEFRNKFTDEKPDFVAPETETEKTKTRR